jgi:magnesium transporter
MDATMAQTNNRLNQVVKTLTVLSTMLMSASLVAGIYGMNFKYMPELEWRYGYFGALGLMVGIVSLLGFYFKRIGWF